jgi:hypothetical protein
MDKRVMAHPLSGGLHAHLQAGYGTFHPHSDKRVMVLLSNICTSTAGYRTFQPWTRGSEACSGGYEFSSIERRFTHFFILLQAGCRTFQPQQRGLQHALKVTNFHPWRGGLHIFSSIHKLVTDLFNHRQDCYNMLLRSWVFIHWAVGYIFFHPSTSWLRNFSTTDKRVTTCSWGYEFSSIERRVTHFFIHLQAGYRTFQPQTRGLQHALDVTIFHPLRGGLHNFFIYLQADYVTFHPQKKRVTASLSNHSALSVAGWLL